MSQKYSLKEISNLKIDIPKPSIIFLYWDLWAWKTTLSRSIIEKNTGKNHGVTSPTYVYYNKYEDVYHFDLYRCRDYDEFVSIWGEEILDNNQWIILIEWPQVLEKAYTPDLKIELNTTSKSWEREIILQYSSQFLWNEDTQ
jgi:tRNA threonylcarbamoyladenosine biosynthesis protein TsaE